MIKNFARGVGTFDVYAISDEPTTPSSLLTEVQNVIDSSLTGGISGLALSPTPVPIDIKIRLVTSSALTGTLKGAVQTAISKYFDSLDLGGSMIIDQVTKTILNSSNVIQQFDYVEVKINNRLSGPVNYTSSSNERLYLRNLVIL